MSGCSAAPAGKPKFGKPKNGVTSYSTFSVAVCCSVLQCVAVCCSVLQCVAVCCSVLQCTSYSTFRLRI